MPPLKSKTSITPRVLPQIGRSSLLLLDLFAEYLSDTGLTVEIGGHTDDIGSDSDNLSLSESRAQSVRELPDFSGCSSAKHQRQRLW